MGITDVVAPDTIAIPFGYETTEKGVSKLQAPKAAIGIELKGLLLFGEDDGDDTVAVTTEMQMALTVRLFLHPIKASLTSLSSSPSSSSLSRSTIPFYGRFEPLKTCVKGLEPVLLQNHCRRSSHWKLYVQRCYANNFCNPGQISMFLFCYLFVLIIRTLNVMNGAVLLKQYCHDGILSGRKLVMGSVFGASVVFGSIFLRPRVAYAMDACLSEKSDIVIFYDVGFDVWGDDHHFDLSNASDAEEDARNFLALARKLLLPVFLFLTVMMNWDHPIILATKIILILVGTKPSPFSVYLFIEQLRRQFMRQHPFLYKFKSLYAKKVEVDDYTFLCLARVELEDQKFTLIGILGSWWVLPWSPCQGAFSVLRNKVLQG
ncbi:unnamed protein product [Camellia sinensis]